MISLSVSSEDPAETGVDKPVHAESFGSAETPSASGERDSSDVPAHANGDDHYSRPSADTVQPTEGQPAADSGTAPAGPTASAGQQTKPSAARKKKKKGKKKAAGGKAAGRGNRIADALAGTQADDAFEAQRHSGELAVRVRDLAITYRTTFEKKPTLRQALTRFGRGQRAVKEIEALHDLSFDVTRGTAMGIIGANGAGKSTLMRAMAGTLPPTRGTVEIWGHASTLLALGVGFNNQLSGRENIILGGLASGWSRQQVVDRADQIAEWTELGDFIDMPMRSYSSGMYSRLAFSVAVHMEPDILMIDEALSTGDAHFRAKATAKMQELRSQASAMFLVSHGMNSIKEMCNEVMWIDHGRLMERGDPKTVIQAYLKHQKVKRSGSATDDT